MPRYPSLFQINARVWLKRLSREAGKRVTLADIDDATIGRFAEKGFDWIWLLSVWQIGAAGRAVSRGNLQWTKPEPQMSSSVRSGRTVWNSARVESGSIGICWMDRAAAEMGRYPQPGSVELTLMKKTQAGGQKGDDRRRLVASLPST